MIKMTSYPHVLFEVKINKYFRSIDIKYYDWVRDPFNVSIVNLIG